MFEYWWNGKNASTCKIWLEKQNHHPMLPTFEKINSSCMQTEYSLILFDYILQEGLRLINNTVHQWTFLVVIQIIIIKSFMKILWHIFIQHLSNLKFAVSFRKTDCGKNDLIEFPQFNQDLIKKKCHLQFYNRLFCCVRYNLIVFQMQ